MTRPTWHILLIEDSADDRADLRQMLLRGSDRRFTFSEAELGAEGVRLVLDGTQGPFDCVLLDHGLPDMDAPEVLAALCRGAGMTPCPVVVLTGTVGEEGLKLLGAGAQDYLGKRWTSADSLTRAVENAIERFALMTEQRRVADALRTSEERYRALFNSIDSGFAIHELIFDASGTAVDARYLQVNPAFARQSGLADAEGRTVSELLPGLEPVWLETYGAVVRTGEPVRLEQYSELMQRWFDLYAFRLGPAQAGQFAVLFRDISERRLHKAALLAAKAEAERANRAKSDFLLSMSHELRSPLHTMLGFTQLIEAGTPAPTAAQQDSVQQILSAGWYLLSLINESLDLSSIETGKQLLSMQTVSLTEAMDDCRSMVEPQAQAAGIDLHFNGPHQPCLVQADATRIKQVLLNLLTNAIKYNRSPGRVDVGWAAAPGRRVRVTVADTGLGLSAAQMAQLFEPFNRLGQECDGVPGTGIGLVISKRLIELMGGRIGVDSAVGVGSCFWFELDATPLLQVPGPPLRTLLCIENDAAHLQQVEELLAEWPDVCLLRADDIRRGLDIARSARPDVILMGVSALGPSAVQALLLLEKDPATTHIPVIALAAAALPRDATAGIAVGFFDYLTQPVQSDTFKPTLERAFQRARTRSPIANADQTS